MSNVKNKKSPKKWLFLIIGLIIVAIAFFYLGKIFCQNQVQDKEENKTEQRQEVSKAEKEEEKQEYSYEDFMGLYVSFEEEPDTNILEWTIYLDDKYFLQFPWVGEGDISEITDKKIDGDILTITWKIPDKLLEDNQELYQDADKEGVFSLKLSYEENRKILTVTENNFRFYYISEEEFLSYQDMGKTPSQIIKEMQEQNSL